MSGGMVDPTKQDVIGATWGASISLPPGRLEELAPRLAALLADFAHLEALESSELEPLPGLYVSHAEGDGDD
jgi:hypothetical protein